MRTVLRLTPIVCFTLAAVAQQGTPVSEITITPESEARVRPFESLVLQVRAYAQVPQSGGTGTQRVRLQRGGGKMQVVQANGGWVSKPFKFQGNDTEAFFREGSGTFASVFGSLTKDYVLQDSFLYIAPETPGKYEVEATLEGKAARFSIDVTPDGPSRKPTEQHNWGAEPRAEDPYRKVVEHWAPMFAQEGWFQPKADVPTRFDYDGDWHGDNNWDNLDQGTSQAYIYYAAMETASHWFLIYNAFHPRDYSDKCVVGTCHENDNEGLILTVRKDGSEFGKLEVMETLAHNNVYSFVNDRRIRSGAHNVDGDIEFYQDSHPVAFIESGGHGIYGTRSAHAKYTVAADKFTNGIGMTFVYKGVAERPKHANDRLVGYDLLPIQHHWWSRAADDSGWKERTFDEFYVYQPFGNRPAGTGKRIGGTFLGRKQSSNKAKPFWGWHDTATRKKNILATGQWGLDPAYAITKTVTYPAGEAPDTTYTYNPYLGIE